MKKQIHPSSGSEARRGNAPSIIHHRGSAWPGLLLAGCCAVMIGLAHPMRAAVIEAWVHRYSNVLTNSNDQAVKVVRDAAGDIIVTGKTEGDMLTIKYSGADGSVLWQKHYNGPANSSAYASAMAVDGSDNVVVTGWSNGSGGSLSDYYTVKYGAADGTPLWEKRYNGAANGDDYAYAVAVDSAGNVVVTGSSNNGTNDDYYTAKYAAVDGVLLWEKRYDGPANGYDRAQSVAVDGSGNVVVTGFSIIGSARSQDYYTAKYAAADGALLWEKRYNGPANVNEARAVAVDGSGNVVVTGTSFGNGSGYDYYTAKYAAADGTLLWEQRYNGPASGEDGASAVAVDSSGNAVVTGSSSSGTNGANGDYYTAKYAAANGALLWEKRYNGPGNNYGNYEDYASAVAVDASGNVVVTGLSVGNGGYDYYTAKYAAVDGVLLWEKRYNGPANHNDFAQAIAVDNSGNVVVTGASGYEDYWSGEYYDYYTAKYAATDGALLWEKRYNGQANRDDTPFAVAVDTSGNVVVTGISFGNGSGYDYYTAKYAATDGALVWEQRYNGPANCYYSGQAVAVDASGKVVVTGSSVGNGGYDYYTAKYAAADGALLWERRCNGCGSATAVALDGSGNVVVTGDSATIKYLADGTEVWTNYTGANALAVDPSGNVVVTGTSWNTNFTIPDYYTAKYAAADGALLWEQRYNGPANSGDYARAVAVDGSGNVVVTGTSYNANFNADYYTAKYAAADGVLLWENRYNSPENLRDSARAVAVDGNGNVLVTGSSYSGTGYYFTPAVPSYYYTAKYAAVDGALLWEKRSNGYGTASAVSVDGSGNVVVTGTSYKENEMGDYYTAKYAAADGTLLWEKRYNGPANGNDRVGPEYILAVSPDTRSSRNLAIGPNGMVAITGSSDGNFGSGTAFDYATVVYWEKLPPVSVALVPAGVRLRFTGVPGHSYSIERAPAVNGPWSTVATPTAPVGGLIEYVDTNAPVGTAFYRTVQP